MATEQYKVLLSQLTEECDNALWLRSAVIFIATLTDRELSEVNVVLKLVEKGGVH